MFKDRVEAGKELVESLKQYKDKKDVVVIALPRGGIIPAYEIAKELNAPLDIEVSRKIGAPFNPELAVGAIGQHGEAIWNEYLLTKLGLEPEDLQASIEEEKKEIERRLNLYRGDKNAISLTDKTVIIVDDGIATGATVRAALRSIKKQNPKKTIVAVPVLTSDALEMLRNEVDEVVYLLVPEVLYGISAFYESFAQVSDNEVIRIMKQYGLFFFLFTICILSYTIIN